MLNFCLYKPCAMCLSLLHFQPCAGSEPVCNCCLSNKYSYMQLRSPKVTRVNFLGCLFLCNFLQNLSKSQTKNFYVQIRPSTEFGTPPSFFFLSLPLSRREHIRDLIG